MFRKIKCCFCGKLIEYKYSHSPEPANTDKHARCCNMCNLKIVIPHRLKEVHEKH